jgi:hypothetical protein
VKINDVIKEEIRVSATGTPNSTPEIEAEKQKNAARTAQLKQAQGNTPGDVSPGDQARADAPQDPNLGNVVPKNTPPATTAIPAAQTAPNTPNPANTTAGTKPGFFKSLFDKNAKAQRGATAQIQKYAQPRIEYWHTIIGADPSMANNRQALQQYVQGFIKDRIPPRDVTPPTDMSTRGVADYITNWVGKFTTADVNNVQRRGGIGTYGAPKQDLDLDINGVNYRYSAANKQWTDENGETYQEPKDVQQLNKLAYQKMNPQAGRAEAGATIGGAKLPKGVEIISQEPIIVRYKNTDFAMDNRGQWTKLKGDPSNLQSFQAYLDQVSAMSESVDLAEVLWQKIKRAR